MYSVGKVSKLFGLSLNGLKMYEKEGIIRPERKPDSGYRDYSYEDIMLLFGAKKCRSFGYSVKDTLDFEQQGDLDGASEMLDGQERELRREIVLMDMKLGAIAEMKSFLGDISDKLDKCGAETFPAFYRTEFSRDGVMDVSPARTAWFNRCLEYLPFIYVSDRLENGVTYGGFKIDERWSGFFDIYENSQVRRYPPHSCLKTIINSGERTPAEGVSAIRAFAEKENIPISDSFLCDRILGAYRQGRAVEYKLIYVEILQ